MYCPTCGSNNQDDLKYCTHCGTNLAVVSEALSGKVANPVLSEAERIALLKNYYSGRRSAIIGFITVAISAFKLSLSSFLGSPGIGFWFGPFFILLTIVGLLFIVRGGTRWIDASSELKALRYENPRQALPDRNRPAMPEQVKGYTTGSMNPAEKDIALFDVPASVTEHTTKSLQERGEVEPRPHKVSN